MYYLTSNEWIHKILWKRILWFCYENGKKNYPQVYLEECKYKIKKTKMSKFINTELESGSESELESDTELESNLDSDSE